MFFRKLSFRMFEKKVTIYTIINWVLLENKILYLYYGRNNIITQEKADDDMNIYVKTIQATPTLSGMDAIDIVR